MAMVLFAFRGSRPNAGTCTDSDNINVSSVVNPSNNIEENNNDSNNLEDDNLSCLENKIINEDNLSNFDSGLGPDNNKTLNIFGIAKK